MNRAYAALKYSVGVACTYEAAAIFLQRNPTISMLCNRRRWLCAPILGGLAAHLLIPIPRPNTAPAG